MRPFLTEMQASPRIEMRIAARVKRASMRKGKENKSERRRENFILLMREG